MFSILWPALVAIIGALIYGYAKTADLKDIGRIAFIIGLFWTVYVLTGSAFTVGGASSHVRPL